MIEKNKKETMAGEFLSIFGAEKMHVESTPEKRIRRFVTECKRIIDLYGLYKQSPINWSNNDKQALEDILKMVGRVKRLARTMLQ